jgi:pyruvate,water dikinase
MPEMILSLDSMEATLETVGGKGMSLSKLSRAGITVPGGFHITTGVYRRFVSENGLDTPIREAITGADPSKPESLESASRRIATAFSAANIPADIASAIIDAYVKMEEPAVAVRSSATAEDLPDASFAGQQDTYLNINGKDAVLDAVKRCWASLWTGRAIGYRLKSSIDQECVAIAVVIQELFMAEASGVMFTANPVNGSRGEIVINAAWGLGEAVVSGEVTPDTFVAEKSSDRLLRRTVADKQVMTVRTNSGTEERPVPAAIRRKPALSRRGVEELARTGKIIETLYGMPMDIEWAFANGKFAVLQARPVTSLPEPPLDWTSPLSKGVLMRMSFAEFVPNAVSPLFATLGVPIAEKATLEMFRSFMGPVDADRLPFAVVNSYVYMGMVLSPKFVWTMMKAGAGAIKKMLKTGYERWQAVLQKYRMVVETWQRKDLTALAPSELLSGAKEIFTCTVECYNTAQSGTIPSAISSELSFTRFYNTFIRRKGDPDASIFLVGLENLPLRAEKSLFDLGQWISVQPGLAGYFRETTAKILCVAFRQSGAVPEEVLPIWSEFVVRLEAHLSGFGHTVYDLDFAKPVPADDPAPLFETLKAYLDGKGLDPYTRQCASEEKRGQASRAILSRIGKWRGKWFAKLLKWAQEAAPRREDSIGDLGLGYPVLRRIFNETGRRLAADGVIAKPEDIYWLEAGELEDLIMAMERGEERIDLSGKTEERKAIWQRVRSVRVPPVIPEKSLLAGMMKPHRHRGNLLKGLGASGGKVTARACVMRDPGDFGRMRPGDVIVAVTTTPAWTPLFAMASAVVTEIGGPLSHSSIVAREYGIPAVLAVGNAARLIEDGQTVTVDGTAGTVTLKNHNRD